MAKLSDSIGEGRTLSSIFPMPPASRIGKQKDAAGHEHGEAGRFVSMAASHGNALKSLKAHYDPSNSDAGDHLDSANKAHVDGLLSEVGNAISGSNKTPKQRIEDKHTDPKTGAVDYDKSTSERRAKGHLPPSTTMRPQAVFMMGGSGSGKSGIVDDYIGNHGSKDQAGNVIAPGHPDFKAAQPGFDVKRVFEADAEKKLMPLYSDTTGKKRDRTDAPDSTMYGASGPKNGADLAKYTPEEQEAMHEYVRRNTKFKDAHDFARSVINGPRSKNPEDGHFNDGKNSETEFDLGLTHKLSTHIVKEKLQHALAHPEDGSFIYDSNGNDNYKGWSQQARDNGYQSIFHEAVHHTPDANGHGMKLPSVEVAQYRNQGRPRSMDPAALAETHRELAPMSERLNNHSRDLLAAGANHDHRHTPTMSDEDVAEAVNAGMTPDGPPAGFEHPRKKAKRIENERAAAQARDAAVVAKSLTRETDDAYGNDTLALIYGIGKAVDSSGHSHDANGRFGSGEGAAKIPKRGEEGSRYMREQRGDKGRKWALYEKRDGANKRVGTTSDYHAAMMHIFHGNEDAADKANESRSKEQKAMSDRNEKWSAQAEAARAGR